MPDQVRPSQLEVNAFDGSGRAHSPLADGWRRWTLQHAPPAVRAFLRAPPRADPRDWRDQRVGWGLVLPFNPALTSAELETAVDAPEPIQELVRRRGTNGRPASVLRHVPEDGHIGFLRRGAVDLPVNQSLYGTGERSVPRYLLIYARPDQIPWEVQYSLQSHRCVGRLSLEGEGLDNYVAALLDEWKDAGAEGAGHDAALVWAADHRNGDITSLMRESIAAPVAERLRSDPDIGPGTHFIDGSREDASAAALAHALAARRPGFIVSTSHGMTGPLDQVDLMTAQLGLPVDSNYQLVKPDVLLRDWQPGGAIWYAHACCGAGSDVRTLFDGLLEQGSAVDLLLQGVTRCGARVAPLPQALLGARRPLRAFIGHVEPTFNWTLQQRETRQFTTDPLLSGLYEELFQPLPVGLALAPLYAQLGGLYVDYERFLRKTSHFQMLHRLLVVRDTQSTVILGDPTVALPI
ncbi:hypothetical protein [Massilia sp.]|uniref:hypothetical protein n=1 Tax=Massilia sp. TaxID=1882437 RepID=UPI00391B1591